MFVIKVVSFIYMAAILVFFIHSSCKSKNAEESTGSKVLLLLQGAALAYVILN